jgi:hypothetical protein
MERSKFFHLPDGEEAEVKFLHAEEVPNHFNSGKTTLMRYYLEVNGRKMLWDRCSRKLAVQMSEILEDSVIKIKRTGQKSKTEYHIEMIKTSDN